jgi:HrpA-like RNA helicase
MRDLLKCSSFFGDARRAKVLPLHSGVPAGEQRLVFQRAAPGIRKVVLATNIAETSVTIDDIITVVDAGRMKQMSYDSRRRINSLAMTGRAGRVQAGRCYHLYTRRFADKRLLVEQQPEMQRVSLESLALKIKDLGMGSIAATLARALSPPSHLHLTTQYLVDLGALTLANAADEDFELTPLGVHLAQLPVDVRVGKTIL